MAMKSYPPEFKADAVALLPDRPVAVVLDGTLTTGGALKKAIMRELDKQQRRGLRTILGHQLTDRLCRWSRRQVAVPLVRAGHLCAAMMG